ncbi:MAG TPA: Spy/CpxP family protein refolding chaperone [Burkholderiales bacterium]|nr:Spy/CpxP family protein refolding chaperone [Burkholderiales bacterium]
MNKLILTTLVSAGLAAATPLSMAQTAGAEGGPQARQSAQRQHHEQRAFRSPSDRVEARLAYLKTALKITDAQLPQWNAYAETRRKQAREATERMQKFRAQMGERKPGTQPTAVERLERRQAMLAVASTRLNETLAATKPLYAALSPDQQKIADEVLAPRGRGGFQHRGGHGRGRA